MSEKLLNLARQLEGEFFYDTTMRTLYATDASAYREMPLAVAIALLIIEMFLPDRSRRRSARSAAIPPVISAAAGTVAVLLFFALPFAARSAAAPWFK